MAAMEGTGAIPAGGASNVCGVMPWASAVLRASARKASNLGVAEPGATDGGAMGIVTEGCAGGVGLGAVVAQATATRVPHRAARRWRPVRAGVWRAMGRFVHRFGVFLAEKLAFLPD